MNDTIDAITLGVADVSTARRFFEQGFGSGFHSDGDKVTFELTAGDSAVPFTLVPWEALSSSVGAAPEHSGFRGYALSYIVESATQVDTIIERLRLAGGVISKPPRGVVWGYSAYVTDPSGCLWKIASPKAPPLWSRKKDASSRTHANEPIPAQEISLIVGVADMKISKTFYSSLGFRVDKDYSKFVSFDGGNSVGLALYRWDLLAADAGVSPPGTGFRGFALTRRADSEHAVDSLLTHAEQGGARIITAGSEIKSGGYRGYFADPDGFLWTVSASSDARTV